MEEKKTLSIEAVAEANDFATTPIPVEKRRSTFSVSVVLIGLCISMGGLYTGASLAGSLSLSQTIWAALLGNVILTIYGGLLGIIGVREGLSINILVRHSFGRMGSYIISAIIAITLLGWYGWQCRFFGETIFAMFPGGGFMTQPDVAGIWGGILMMITAYMGYKGLSILSSFAAPLIFILAVVAIGVATGHAGGWKELVLLSESTAGGSVSFASAVVSVVGAFAVGGVIQPDCTRYCKTPKTSVVATIVGFIGAHTVVILSGYVVSVVSGYGDLATSLLSILGGYSLVILIFAQWTTNDNNLYSSSLGITNIFPRFKKKHVVLVIGPIATIGGALGAASSGGFVTFLIVLGTVIPPVAGVVIADYFILHKSKYQFGTGTRYGFLSIPAIIAWIAGGAVGFTVSWGITSINALVVSAVVYLIVNSFFKKDPNKKFIFGFCVENEYGETNKI